MNIPLLFTLKKYSGEIIDVFSDLTKTLTLAFWQTLFKGGLSNLRDYNLVRGLAIHTRFDDLELILRSQVCQNNKLQVVFRFLSNVI